MSEDIQLSQYKVQLQQVEAALELDQDNKELVKLKFDLEEVIKLTLELLGKPADGNLSDNRDMWKKGDQCLAMWPKDKQYYKAVIEEILEDGMCEVSFAEFSLTSITQTALIKPMPVEGATALGKRKKKDDHTKTVEKKRKKAQKRVQDQEEMEKACEEEKCQWQQFSKRMRKQGKMRKSIFTSPESVDGRVGVGTCGSSGKPMTKFPARHNYLKK